jgi:hypothetical protein
LTSSPVRGVGYRLTRAFATGLVLLVLLAAAPIGRTA